MSRSTRAEAIFAKYAFIHKRHHVPPVQTWKDGTKKTIFSKDVTDRVEEYKIDTSGEIHKFNDAHQTYNRRAQAIIDRFIEKEKLAGVDPQNLSGSEARQFADNLVKELEKDGYIQKI